MSIPFYSNLVAVNHIMGIVKNDVLFFSLTMCQKFASKHRFLVTILLTLIVSLYYTICKQKYMCTEFRVEHPTHLKNF